MRPPSGGQLFTTESVVLVFDWTPGFLFELQVLGGRNQCLLWIANAELLRGLDKDTQLGRPSQCPAEVTKMASTVRALSSLPDN